ncbi:MAG: PAS domain S-box protein [Fibrobacteria bacterium]
MADKPALPWWTWALPFLIFHFGTGLSLGFRVSPGLSLWYLPVPLGIILIHWWGPRVLLGLFVNSMLCAGYWGLYRWWLWPLYAVPETLKVALSWWLFSRLMKGSPWLPNLSNTWKFLLFGVILPCGIATFYGQAQFALLGDIGRAHLLRNTYVEFVLDVLSPFAITVPALIFGTAWMERLGLSVTQGSYPPQSLFLRPKLTRPILYESAAVFAALLVLCLYVPLKDYWFLYGIVLIGSALRFGFAIAALASMWTILITLPLPAMLSSRFSETIMSQGELLKINLNLATLCFAALVVGRALCDMYQEIQFRGRVEDDLRKSISEWEQMRDTVREGEAKYRILFESASDPIIVGDNGIFVDCNEKALEVFGASRGEFLGSHATRFFPATLPDGSDSAAAVMKMRIAAMEGTPQRFEWKLKRLDGSLFDTEMSFVGVTLDGKRMVMSVVRDITERKAMEKALSENESRYRTLFESANDAIVLSSNGVIVDCNQRCAEIFRYRREELLGQPTLMCFPEFQPEGVRSDEKIKGIRAAAMTGAPQSVEWNHIRSDKTIFESEASLNRVLIGGMAMLQVVIRDVSERKRIERALIESEERFRQMAENIQEVFFLLDKATRRLLYLSPLAKNILGIPVSYQADRTFTFLDRVHPDDRVRIDSFTEGAWHRQPFNEDFRCHRPDGELRWLRMRTFLIRDGQGEVFRVAGIIADITEYKMAQEEARVHQQRLIQADKMNSLGLMVSGVAHEINNPNNLIMLNGDVMETFWRHMRPIMRDHASQNPDWKLAGIPYGSAEGKFETLLGGVSGGAKRIKRIVDNLKDFARMDGGDLSESVAMEKVVEASVGIVENLIKKSTDRFSIAHGDSLPRIRGNFQKLEQVIINLITNACQALDSRDKAVRVLTWHEKDTDSVGIRVEDEGKGIAAGLLNKVSDPFFTTKRDSGGTGLGLSVTYGIIREHRGNIEIKSEENRGTCVEIRIPALKSTR